LFIAKTLLERSGAKLVFTNRRPQGASVRVRWERADFEESPVPAL
jgi:two-component system sensor histidine kinase RegB